MDLLRNPDNMLDSAQLQTDHSPPVKVDIAPRFSFKKTASEARRIDRMQSLLRLLLKNRFPCGTVQLEQFCFEGIILRVYCNPVLKI